ncbi:TolC family protein [Inhella sp.]|uniref:TolC family protein n=1 Tax=Inhella sp. TaxID=1921806 RepID=UPI0035AE0343
MRRLTPLLAALALALAGCASLDPQPRFAELQQAAAKPLPGAQLLWAQTPEQEAERERRVAALLAQPLSLDAAVQLALLNHRGLQAAYAQLGIAVADLDQASRLPNPGFSFGRNRASADHGVEREIERSLHLNLNSLLSWPMRRAIEARRVEQAQGAALLAVIERAATVRKAWVQAVAAQQTLAYSAQVLEAAEAGAELAARMRSVGNFNKLQQLREQGFQAEAALAHARATAAAQAARERLIRALGLWGDQLEQLRLPERLPDLPTAPAERPEIEREGLAQRLDVQGAKLNAEATARQLGLSRITRFVNVLELGGHLNTNNEGARERGWELSIELPLFDWGGARVARAEHQYRQALAQVADTAINARSELREAYGAYRHAWDIARHQRQVLLPLKSQVSEENLLRYNGMFIGVFELLADARAQVAAVNAAIEAERDFWLAQADLEQALIGKPNLAAAAASLSAPAEAGGGH